MGRISQDYPPGSTLSSRKPDTRAVSETLKKQGGCVKTWGQRRVMAGRHESTSTGGRFGDVSQSRLCSSVRRKFLTGLIEGLGFIGSECGDMSWLQPACHRSH
jgi:hypothetical protein